jgi:hypothetical protein
MPMRATAESPAVRFPSGGGTPKSARSRVSKSRVSNGSALFITGKGTSPFARRFADILAEIVSDLGGADQLSEAQRQLARRGASLSLACERLEAVICDGVSSAAEAAFVEQSGGLTAYQILAEAGRILHGVARIRGGDGIRQMAELPPDELDRVTDLLCRAGDLASKCIAAGSEKTADLELHGTLADRCGRTFTRLGIKRVPKDVGPSLADLMRLDLEDQRVEAEEAAVANGQIANKLERVLDDEEATHDTEGAGAVDPTTPSGRRTSDDFCGGAGQSTGEGPI